MQQREAPSSMLAAEAVCGARKENSKAMKAASLIRTGSLPAIIPITAGSLKPSLSFSAERSVVSSPRVSLQLEMNCQKYSPAKGMRRSLSDSDVPGKVSKFSCAGSRSFPVRIPEEKYASEGEELSGYAGIWTRSGSPLAEFGFRGGGSGTGRKSGGGSDGGCGNGDGHRSKIGDYYRELLKMNPGDPLMLRNYGKYLHEVEKDAEKAEEYYERAILASPGDGELLCLYGKLIWETKGDEIRAKSYFDQAINASPNDSMVLGSYAHFMWEAEEDDEGEKFGGTVEVTPLAVAAF